LQVVESFRSEKSFVIEKKKKTIRSKKNY